MKLLAPLVAMTAGVVAIPEGIARARRHSRAGKAQRELGTAAEIDETAPAGKIQKAPIRAGDAAASAIG